MTGFGAEPLTRIQYVKKGRVALVTLNRPEVRTAMDRAMHGELVRVWDDFERDDSLWAAVLTGPATARSPRART